MNFLQHVDRVTSADADTRGGPLSDTVHREEQRPVERRRAESAGRVTLVLSGEQQLVLSVEAGRSRLEPFAQQVLLEQFLLEPKRQSHQPYSSALTFTG